MVKVTSISIVSHGQANLVKDLLQDIELFCQDISIEVLLTLNIEESLPKVGKSKMAG